MRRITRLRSRAGFVATVALLASASLGIVTARPAHAAGVGDCIQGADWGTSRTDLASGVVTLVNQHRTDMGLVALKVSPTLTDAATWKARHMARYGYMAHDDPAPPVARTVSQRLQACGYPAATSGWGENIAYGYQTAASVTQAWLNSPGHRANIENSSYRVTGVGAAASAGGTVYWSQEFGTFDDSGSGGGGGPPPPPPPAAPTVALTSGPPASTTSTTASFAWTTSGSVSSISCTLDNGFATACSSPWSYGYLASGTHTFRVTVANAGGSASAVSTWTVSAQPPPPPPPPTSTAPTVRITSSPGAWTSSRTATFGWTTTGSVSSTTCSLDYSVAVSCSSPRAYTVSPGRHTFRVTVAGSGGSASSTATWYAF